MISIVAGQTAYLRFSLDVEVLEDSFARDRKIALEQLLNVSVLVQGLEDVVLVKQSEHGMIRELAVVTKGQRIQDDCGLSDTKLEDEVLDIGELFGVNSWPLLNVWLADDVLDGLLDSTAERRRYHVRVGIVGIGRCAVDEDRARVEVLDLGIEIPIDVRVSDKVLSVSFRQAWASVCEVATALAAGLGLARHEFEDICTITAVCNNVLKDRVQHFLGNPHEGGLAGLEIYQSSHDSLQLLRTLTMAFVADNAQWES